MGVSLSDAKSAREFLLVVSSSLLFFGGAIELQQNQCLELLETLLERRAGNNPLLLNALTLRYTYQNSTLILGQKGARPGRIKFFLMGGVVVLTHGWYFIVTKMSLLVIQVAAVVSILQEPSAARWISILVAAYVFSVYLIVIGMNKILGTVKPTQIKPVVLSDFDERGQS